MQEGEMENTEKKKGLFAKVKESMDKTGGCNCGPGDACYPEKEKEAAKQEKCCGDSHGAKECK
jgi:hypothetical protein